MVIFAAVLQSLALFVLATIAAAAATAIVAIVATVRVNQALHYTRLNNPQLLSGALRLVKSSSARRHLLLHLPPSCCSTQVVLS
jgi:hypothetical protein